MTITQRLADLLTGGDYSRAKVEEVVQRARADLMREKEDKRAAIEREIRDNILNEASTYRVALMDIIAMETPSMGGTPKKMLRRAREAVK